MFKTILSGVPQALISVNAIDYLCDLFSSSNDTTIGIASVALGYLSHVPEGQRKLLHRYVTHSRTEYSYFLIIVQLPWRTGYHGISQSL